jgi:hypothetical protein
LVLLFDLIKNKSSLTINEPNPLLHVSIIIAKYQIGPSDTPPCGRVPGFQAPKLRVSGVPPEADQVSGKKNENTEN